MDFLNIVVDEVEMRLDEIKVALKRCRIEGYSLKSVKEAMSLIVALIEDTKDVELQNSLMATLEKLKEKRKQAKELEDEEKKKRGTKPATGGDLAQVFPLIANEDIQMGEVCNTAIIDSQDFCFDNALVLYGAFEEELIYIASGYAKKHGATLRLIDCRMLAEKYAQNASFLLEELSQKAGETQTEVILYHNVHYMKSCPSVEESFCYYVKEMRSMKNVRQIAVSTKRSYGVEAVYKDWVEKLFTDEKKDIINIYSGSLPFVYVELPTFAMVKTYIRNAFQIEQFDEETEKLIQKSYYLLGYKGLSELLATATDKTWQEEAKLLTDKNKAEFEEFLVEFDDDLDECLPEDWKYRRKKKKTVELPPSDDDLMNPKFEMPRNEYDTIDDLHAFVDRVEKILNYEGCTVKEKVGWAGNYALHNGDIFNNLVGLGGLEAEVSEKILRERYELAYDALSELMKVPRGELLFDIPKSDTSLNGQCCDGGKTIRLNARYLSANDSDTVIDGLETLLHELFHALQHAGETAAVYRKTDPESEKLLQYYWVHFAVTPYRIEEWRKNFTRYRSGGNFEDYEDQVVEADARIFATERLEEYKGSNHPKLD